MASCMETHGITATAAVNFLVAHATLDEIVAGKPTGLAAYQNSAAYGCDPERIFVAGSLRADTWRVCWSVGVGTMPFGVPEKIVKGGVLLSGLYDLEPIQLCYANEWVVDETSARRNSPWLICRQLVSPDTVLWWFGDQ